MEPDLRQFYMDLEMRSGLLLRSVKNDIELVGERNPLASNDF